MSSGLVLQPQKAAALRHTRARASALPGLRPSSSDKTTGTPNGGPAPGLRRWRLVRLDCHSGAVFGKGHLVLLLPGQTDRLAFDRHGERAVLANGDGLPVQSLQVNEGLGAKRFGVDDLPCEPGGSLIDKADVLWTYAKARSAWQVPSKPFGFEEVRRRRPDEPSDEGGGGTGVGLCCTNRVMAEVPLSPDGLIPQLP
jgi:hypothetical protein